MQIIDNDKKRMFIQSIQDLPTLPTTLIRIINIADSSSSSANDLADTVSKDPSISSVILRIVNSAFYGHMRKVSSISHAIVILGFQTVKAMAMGVSVFQSSPSGENPNFNRNQFWLHSIGVATLSRVLADSSTVKLDKEAAFMAGLLHDLGKVVFDNYFFDEYVIATQIAKDEGLFIGEVEKRILGLDHCEAGGYLADKWQFPKVACDSIKFHNNPRAIKQNDELIGALVHVADFCCREMGLGSKGEAETVEIDTRALTMIGIKGSKMDEAIAEVEKNRSSIESFVLN